MAVHNGHEGRNDTRRPMPEEAPVPRREVGSLPDAIPAILVNVPTTWLESRRILGNWCILPHAQREPVWGTLQH